MYKKLPALFLFIISFNVNSQPWNYEKVLENYLIFVNAGTSTVVTEYKRDWSGIINEMHHRSWYSYALGISKSFTQNWDFGYEYEFCFLKGFQDNPDFSAYRYGHYKISLMDIKPVIYHTRVKCHNFVATYHFNNYKGKRFIPFVYVKLGGSKLFSELMYASDYKLIFAKIGWKENMPDASVYIVNFNVGAGLGLEWVIDQNLSINLKTDINHINDDNLDGVHNFDAPPPEGYHNSVYGFYGRAMIGLSYYINPDRERKATRKYLLEDSFKNNPRRKGLFQWH